MATVCRRCGRDVANRADYEMFERMHYVCFHYEFEHQVDVDVSCGVGGCPSAAAGTHRDQLVSVIRELAADWRDGTPADWGNTDLGDYLSAVAEHLERGVGELGLGDGRPWSSWQQMADALRGAAAVQF